MRSRSYSWIWDNIAAHLKYLSLNLSLNLFYLIYDFEHQLMAAEAYIKTRRKRRIWTTILWAKFRVIANYDSFVCCHIQDTHRFHYHKIFAIIYNSNQLENQILMERELCPISGLPSIESPKQMTSDCQQHIWNNFIKTIVKFIESKLKLNIQSFKLLIRFTYLRVAVSEGILIRNVNNIVKNINTKKTGRSWHSDSHFCLIASTFISLSFIKIEKCFIFESSLKPVRHSQLLYAFKSSKW